MRRDRYRLCDRVVTVYHREGPDRITRTVHPRAFLDSQKVMSVARTGSAEANGFLLVIPGDAGVCVGDKVVPGEGPEVTTDEQWRDLIPTKVAGCVVVKQVDVKWYRGELVHTEAGG